MTERNYLKDILFGTCVGDALGVPVEFESRESLKQNPVLNMRYGGVHEQGRGVWSDDSSLSFCLAESILEGYDLHKLAAKFVDWKTKNYWTATGEVFDIGGTTQIAIAQLEQGKSPLESGGMEEFDNGNGSLMRILPLLVYIKDLPIEERFHYTKEVSSITHAHPRSVLACFYVLEFALLLLKAMPKVEAYNQLKVSFSAFVKKNNYFTDELTHFDRLLNGNIAECSEDEIKSGGYVIDTLEASMWCILTTTNYHDAVVKAVNLGEDTDTTAAVTGGLVGLLYGYASIPKTWIYCIANIDAINALFHYQQHNCNALQGRLKLRYNVTTLGDYNNLGPNGEDFKYAFEKLDHEIDATMHLTNDKGVNTIELNFNYPHYPVQGDVNCEMQSQITCGTDQFFFMIDFKTFEHISAHESIIKGGIAVNIIDSPDVDCFFYEFHVQQTNCREIILNSTLGEWNFNVDGIEDGYVHS